VTGWTSFLLVESTKATLIATDGLRLFAARLLDIQGKQSYGRRGAAPGTVPGVNTLAGGV
jgi:hypothetical protein